MRLIDEELLLEGDPQHNLATFVTTWMEPEAQRIIAENLHRNFIDHAEYPRTAEIEQRCIRMLADLYHAPGETTGARTQGSSEAIMLGALSLKWNWRKRREAAGKPIDRPNLVFGGDVHVVWEKFCRYFDVEPRIVPLQEHKYTIGPEEVEPHLDENTIGVAAVLGTTFTGHRDDVVGIDKLLGAIRGAHRPLRTPSRRRRQRRVRLAVPLPGLRVGLPARPRALHQRVRAQVRTRLSGHRLAHLPRAQRPQRGPGVHGELPRQGRRDLHPQLLHRRRDGARAVLQLRPLRARGIRLHHGDDEAERDALAEELQSIGNFELVGADEEQLPLVAFKLAEKRSYDEFDIAWQLTAERGWMVPAYTLPPDAQHVTLMRALVKETLSREMVNALAGDIADACSTLEKKGGAHASEREQVKTATGY